MQEEEEKEEEEEKGVNDVTVWPKPGRLLQ